MCAERVIDIANYAAEDQDQDGGPLQNDSSDEQFGWLFEKAEELGFKDLAAVTAGELDAIGEERPAKNVEKRARRGNSTAPNHKFLRPGQATFLRQCRQIPAGHSTNLQERLRLDRQGSLVGAKPDQ
jgi:hypothetical protein